MGAHSSSEAPSVFDELKQGVREIEFLADPTVGELRIGAAEPVAAAIVSAVINRLSRQYPRLVFHVLPGETATLYRDLSERHVEFVITRTFEPLPDSQTDAEVLYEDAQVVVAGIKNRWLRSRKLKLADLMDEPWALLPLDSLHGALLVEAFRSAGLDVPRAIVFTFSHELRNSLVGMGPFLHGLSRIHDEVSRQAPLASSAPGRASCDAATDLDRHPQESSAQPDGRTFHRRGARRGEAVGAGR